MAGTCALRAAADRPWQQHRSPQEQVASVWPGGREAVELVQVAAAANRFARVKRGAAGSAAAGTARSIVPHTTVAFLSPPPSDSSDPD